MRDILFRGKRTDNGEWVLGSLIFGSNRYFIVDDKNETALRSCTTHCCDKYDWRSVEVIPETVGQYTGLTDKNGTKVFEGDICKGSWKQIIQIFYDDCNYGFYAKTSEGFCHNIDYWGLDRIEVIGNRYDNPELLKGGAE